MRNSAIIKPECCPPPLIEMRVVQTTAALKKLANTFAQVTDTNDIFYVDSSHRATLVTSAPLFIDDYDYTANPRNLRAKVVYDFRNDLEIIFDNRGKYRIIRMEKN